MATIADRRGIRTTGTTDLNILSPFKRVFHDPTARLDLSSGTTEKISDYNVYLPIPLQVLCSLNCSKTFSTLDAAVRHMWGNDLLLLGHCIDLGYLSDPRVSYAFERRHFSGVVLDHPGQF